MKASLVGGKVKNTIVYTEMFFFSIYGFYLWKPCFLIALHGHKIIPPWLSLQKY